MNYFITIVLVTVFFLLGRGYESITRKPDLDAHQFYGSKEATSFCLGAESEMMKIQKELHKQCLINKSAVEEKNQSIRSKLSKEEIEGLYLDNVSCPDPSDSFNRTQMVACSVFFTPYMNFQPYSRPVYVDGGWRL